MLQRVSLFLASLAAAAILTVSLVSLGFAPVGPPVVVGPVADTAELSSAEPSAEPSVETSDDATGAAPQPAAKADSGYVAPQATPQPIVISNAAPPATVAGGGHETEAQGDD